MLRLVLYATTIWAAYRIYQENFPPVPQSFELPRGTKLGREPANEPTPAENGGAAAL